MNTPFSVQLEAAHTAAVVVPIPDLIQIHVTGRDRATFLHNFCTQDINGLPAGRCAEAFFTNVKARVIAHGWVLAGDDHHEIRMLPGDENRLVGHLNRYIISEDVTIECLTTQRVAFACIGPEFKIVTDMGHDDVNGCGVDEVAGIPVSWCHVRWADVPIRLLTAAQEYSNTIRDTLLQSAELADAGVFERLRIEERFPRAGVDIDEDHLAPEARRDTSAISYTKGCYLGQEPIARLDALGQVNRVLTLLEVSSAPGKSDSPVALTSYNADTSPEIGLGLVRTKDLAADRITVSLPDGSLRLATVMESAGSSKSE